MHQEYSNGNFIVSTDPSKLDIDATHAFLSKESYWAKGIPKEIMIRSIENSLCFGVYENSKQIGFARIISDYATYAYLCDVYILEMHRGKGLAKWLMSIIMAHPSFPWQDEALSVCLHKPQVYIDLSGWSPKYFPPQLIQYANTLLKHKVLFGSDYPMITPDRWLADFEQIAIKPEVRPLILKENAIKLLGLDTSDALSSV